jgi:predicted transposase/invertase (TIGR01784 family)
MTLAERLKREGRQEGEEKAKLRMAASLLKENEAIDRVKRLTGLPLPKLKELQAKAIKE